MRWETIEQSAAKRGIKINNSLVSQLEGDIPSPEIGYIATQKILRAKKSFTALFAFNDISAIGAIRALQESGLRVPEDVSVLGFDDIYAAAFHNPALTTIRQPLFEMGQLAAQTLLQSVSQAKTNGDFPPVISVEPKLVVRQSTTMATTQIIFVIIGVILVGLGLAPVFPTVLAEFTGHFGESGARAANWLFIGSTFGGASLTWSVGFLSNAFGSLRIGFIVIFFCCLLMIALQAYLCFEDEDKMRFFK